MKLALRIPWLGCVAVAGIGCMPWSEVRGSTPSAAPTTRSTFQNPIVARGADPEVCLHDGVYYYVRPGRAGTMSVYAVKDVADLGNATGTVVWRAPSGTPASRELWAPEIHFLDGKWYIYYSADDGKNDNHRLYVLENPGRVPTEGKFESKGQIVTDSGNNWGIDSSVFEAGGKRYMVWSGWPAPVVAGGSETACIYIGRMETPWKLAGERVEISRPTYEWERHWKNPASYGNTPGRAVFVNEGPAALLHGGKVFLTYSASGCWTPYYCLGMLTADENADLTDPKAWSKSPMPVFQQWPEGKVYGTGHNGFFKSPGGEDWLIYHASDAPDECGGGKRSVRMQKIEWDAEGKPVFGRPAKRGEPLERPK